LGFELALVRFGTSGTLIALYGLVDHLARRAGGESLRASVRPPRWMAAVVFASLLGFYLLIRPLGGALADGWGNVAGIGLAFVAMALRWRQRHGARTVRQPEVAARMLFYVALPLATGVTWGWAALTLPAIVASAWWCVREDELLVERHGKTWRERVATTSHWATRLW
jgi:protein-S-isoprenylcysteine O-methyltransferase Ste14